MLNQVRYKLLANEIVDREKNHQATPLKVENDALFGDITEDGVVPDVRIPEWEERRPPRQCNWQKGEVYY